MARRDVSDHDGTLGGSVMAYEDALQIWWRLMIDFMHTGTRCIAEGTCGVTTKEVCGSSLIAARSIREVQEERRHAQ